MHGNGGRGFKKINKKCLADATTKPAQVRTSGLELII